MSSPDETSPLGRAGLSAKALIGATALVVLVGAMALDTRIVVIGSEEDLQDAAFDPARFGQEQFPLIRDSIVQRAVNAPKLAEEIAADQAAAVQQHGVGEGFGPVMPVTFTGVFGEVKSGIYTVAVDGMPEEVAIRVQTGPAINGTELRDATGSIEFGQFTNQIEYQDAGAAINNAMKSEVLAGIDTADLAGKTVTVTGAFKLINPKNWLVTPVQMGVQ